jgi:hypothetical protein
MTNFLLFYKKTSVWFSQFLLFFPGARDDGAPISIFEKIKRKKPEKFFSQILLVQSGVFSLFM